MPAPPPSYLPLRRRFAPYGLILVVYALASRYTDAFFMGDTWIYVTDLLKAKSLGGSFWDFGHALWLPVAWLVSWILQPLGGLGDDARERATLTLMAINWVAGLLSVFVVHSLARRFCKGRWTAYLVTAIFFFSNAILNYAQTGQPYVPGLLLLLIGLRLLVSGGESLRRPWQTGLAAGAALAGAVCFWVALVLSLPAVLLSPVVLFGLDRSRVRLALWAGLVAGLLVALVYGSMIATLGIRDVAGVKAWVRSSTHGVSPDAPLKAVQRMAFALPRNFVNMGDDGRLFKRYLVHDPYSAVSLADLFRLSLWKVALFYVFSLSLVISLLSSSLGRRALGLLLLNGLPVLLFALFLFESGSIDRYLPLFPVLFLALSVALGSDGRARSVAPLALAFVAVATVSNVSAMSTVALDRQQEAATARIRELVPLLKPDSRVVTVNEQDEIYAFNQNFPFNPINRSSHLKADNLIDPGTTQATRWRQIFAGKTLALWAKGGDVWITTRVLHERPLPAWNWVEGDDPRVSWIDIHAFFSRLDTGRSIGGEDGFVLIAPTKRNQRLLNEIARASQ